MVKVVKVDEVDEVDEVEGREWVGLGVGKQGVSR